MAKISAKPGLRISKSKTKGMRINATNADRLQLDGGKIDEVEDFAYLSSDFSKDWDSQLRIGKARTESCLKILSDIQKDETPK